MRPRFAITVSLCAMFVAGCAKKKVVVVPSAPPPPVVASDVHQPPPIVFQPQPKQQKPTETTQTANVPQQPRVRPHHPRHKPSPSVPVEPAKEQTPAVAVSVAPPRITSSDPGAPGGGARNDEDHARATTEQLLDSTDRNLLGIRRQLSQDEQNTVQQIRGYEKDAREALRDQDLTRAHTLALKAHLLADALVAAR